MTLFEVPGPPGSPAGGEGGPAEADEAREDPAGAGTAPGGGGAPPATPDPAGCRRVALGVAYDGSGFHGFAAQPGMRTVAGSLAAALGRLAGREVPLTCAGRTDRGVHALAQVVHFELDEAVLSRRLGWKGGAPEALPALATSLSRQLGEEILVWRAEVAPPGFDARRSACARRYRYELVQGDHFDPLRRFTSWRVEDELDLAAMRLATDPLLGEHDFAAFCRRPPDRPEGPLTRRVLEACWSEHPEGALRFEIEATAFCHQMVRSVVGVLVAVGRGRLRPSDVVRMLRRGEREGAPAPAPATGLCLVAVRYPAELGGTWQRSGG